MGTRRVCRSPTDFSEPWHSVFALCVDTIEYILESRLETILDATPEDTLELESTFETILLAALVAVFVAALKHNP